MLSRQWLICVGMCVCVCVCACVCIQWLCVCYSLHLHGRALDPASAAFCRLFIPHCCRLSM